MSRRKHAVSARTSVQETPEEAISEDPEVNPEEQARIDAEDAQFAAEQQAAGQEPAEEISPDAEWEPGTTDFDGGVKEQIRQAADNDEEVDVRVVAGSAEPEFDPEIFERGPLAAGIRMLNALLVEAEAGYINAQVDELEQILDERLSPDERRFLGRVASELRTASDLPDVAGAYKHLVRARVQAGA
jgi:hypothetical protein